MSDNERLLQRAEAFAATRRILLAVNGLAYLGWIGAQALDAVPGMPLGHGQLALIRLVPGAIWLFSLVALFVSMAMSRSVRPLIDDERTAKFTLRAFQAGYGVLLVSIAALYGLAFAGYPVDMLAVLPILLSLGVAVPSLAYAALYRS